MNVNSKSLHSKTTQGRVPHSLESLLITERALNPEQVVEVHRFQIESQANFGTALMFLKILAPKRIAEILQTKTGIPHADLEKIHLTAGTKNCLAARTALSLQVFPLASREESGKRILFLGMTDPLDHLTLSRVEELTHFNVEPAFLSLEEIQALYVKHYRGGLDLFPPGVAPQKLNSGPPLNPPAEAAFSDSPVVEALISLLVRKEVITRDELSREIEQMETKRLS